MKKCVYCGKEYPDGLNVCPVDGDRLEVPVAKSPPPEPIFPIEIYAGTVPLLEKKYPPILTLSDWGIYYQPGWPPGPMVSVKWNEIAKVTRQQGRKAFLRYYSIIRLDFRSFRPPVIIDFYTPMLAAEPQKIFDLILFGIAKFGRVTAR